MLGRELDQRVLCMNGPEVAQTGEEAEDQVLGDEAPREQADDRSDLAADDRAHADADCAPESCAGDSAEKKERDLPAVEGEVDAAARPGCTETYGGVLLLNVVRMGKMTWWTSGRR